MMPPNTSSHPERWTICVRAGSIREGRVVSGHIHGNMEDYPTNVEVVEAAAYDELREAAVWVVLNWDGERTQHGSMPALRQALGLLSERPTREEAERRINEHIGIEVSP